MQQRNFVLFVLLTFVLFAGWSLVQTWLWPPPPRKPRVVSQKEAAPPAESALPKRFADPRLWGDLLAQTPAVVTGLPGLPGMAGACTLLADARLADPEAQALLRAAARVAREASTPRAPHREIALGDESFNLQAVLTTRGAGVQSLTLNRFQGASDMGLPEEGPLHLLPARLNRLDPSNVLFHYHSADDDRPVDTLGHLEWTVESTRTGPDQEIQEVVFRADLPGRDVRFFKVFSLGRGDYHLGLRVQVQNLGKEPQKVRYQLTSGHGLPIEGIWYTTMFRNALIGLVDAKGGLWREMQDAATISTQAGGNEVRKGDKFIQYAGVAVQYFASVLVVDDRQEKKDFLAWARPTVEGEPHPRQPFLDDIVVRAVTEPIDLKPGEQVTHSYLLYNGPVKVNLLGELGARGKAVSSELVHRYADTLHLRTLQDYGSYGVWTDLLLWCTNLMHSVLGMIHWIIPSYGLCIIVLTLLVRGAMFPISRKQALTSLKMQELAPELKKLQEKYKNDRQAMGMAQMELYRKHGVNPFGSCWVLLLQMPIFLGLYYALQESIHFRLAPFLWIRNLAAPDMLIYWGQSIPIISRPEDMGGFLYLGPYFNLLPVIAVVLMLVQTQMMTPPAMDEQQEMQQKMMKYMMIFFGLMFYKVAAGLCLYFCISSIWGLTERKLLPKARPGAGPVPVSGAGSKGPRAKPTGPRGNGDGMFQKMKDMWEEVLKQAKKK